MGQASLPDNLEQVYAFLCDFEREHRFAPSVREIAQGCYISRSTASRYLDRLEALGWIEREINIARGIRLLKQQTAG